MPPAAIPPANRGKLQFLDVTDPVYGVDMGKLGFFADWQGTAGVLRNDAFCPDCNSLGLHMTSPDRQSEIRTYGEGLHTAHNQTPGRSGLFAQTQFTTTGELIIRYLLPTLNLGGRHSFPRPSLPMQAAAALREVQRLPFGSDAFAQGAAVSVSDGAAGKDYVVEALTIGFFLGAPTESTVTHFTIIQAPAGQADALATAWEALPPMVIHPLWRHRNDKHTLAILQRMQEQGRQQNAQVRQWMQDYNTRQAEFNTRQMAGNAAARDALQLRANQGLLDADQARIDIVDTGDLVIDSRTGSDRYYAFCNTQTGDVVYLYNDTAPPDSSGHWLRYEA